MVCQRPEAPRSELRQRRLNGDVTEWDRDGKIINHDSYIDGKCLIKSVKWYTLGQKHFEGSNLHATGMPEATYDWWNSMILTANMPADVADQQQGIWTEWYPSGNKKAEGQYDRGIATGRFTWWYENGQKQAEGDFENGLKNGVWITWHANGLKESMSEYQADKLVGKLMKLDHQRQACRSRQPEPAAATAAKPAEHHAEGDAWPLQPLRQSQRRQDDLIESGSGPVWPRFV